MPEMYSNIGIYSSLCLTVLSCNRPLEDRIDGPVQEPLSERTGVSKNLDDEVLGSKSPVILRLGAQKPHCIQLSGFGYV